MNNIIIRRRKSSRDVGLAVRPSTWNHIKVPIGQIKYILGINDISCRVCQNRLIYYIIIEILSYSAKAIDELYISLKLLLWTVLYL